jgi:hypothetical protein
MANATLACVRQSSTPRVLPARHHQQTLLDRQHRNQLMALVSKLDHQSLAVA